MPVIVFANPKGGSGKTTAALLLATTLAEKARVTVIDADPERWISQWGALPGRPHSLDIVADVTEDNILDCIEQATQTAQFVIVDLEGTANLMVANAVGLSDLVIIPTQGASMDAKGAAKTIRLVHSQERIARRPIRYAVLLTRTSAAITTRSLRNVRDELGQAGIPMLVTSLVERSAYRDLFSFGGTLADLDPRLVGNLDKAIDNARDFAGEVVFTITPEETEEAAA